MLVIYLFATLGVNSSPNQCFVNKVNELNESVPMDVDRVVVVKAWDDMEIDNDPVEVDNDL